MSSEEVLRYEAYNERHGAKYVAPGEEPVEEDEDW